MSSFLFTDNFTGDQAFGGMLVATIQDITSKTTLLDALATQLHFPDYFGGNWDALSDCLRDLSWIDAQYVVLQHAELPTDLGHDDLRTYIAVLKRCADDWKPGESHQLTIVFPSEARAAVQTLLASL